MAKAIKKTIAPSFATVDHGHDMPRIPESPIFMLVFIPGRWQVMAGQLVPLLSTLPLVPGVNLIEGNNAGGIRASRLTARLAEEGRIRIPFEWAPDGVSYVQAVDTRLGSREAVAYVSVFEEVYAGDSRTHADSEAYADWMSGLINSGKLPQCPPFKVRDMMKQEEARAAVAESSMKKNPTGPNRRAFEVHTANAETLRTIWGQVNPKSAGAKPVRKRAARPSVEL